MPTKSTSCGHCATKPPVRRNYAGGYIGIIFLALLPKCPFCLMAYTSTAMLCAKDGLIPGSTTTHISLITVLFVFLFGLITISAIVLNNKGRRTRGALIAAIVGFLLALVSVLYGGGEGLYYFGIVLLFISVWLNGSLPWLIRSFSKRTNVPAGNFLRRSSLF